MGTANGRRTTDTLAVLCLAAMAGACIGRINDSNTNTASSDGGMLTPGADARPGGGADGSTPTDDAGNPVGNPSSGVDRGGTFFGVPERFNRYYTDPSFVPTRIIYVSRDGGGDGTSRNTPTSVSNGIAQVGAGQQVTFLRDSVPYQGCWELDSGSSGTYDAPVVLYAERNDNGSRGVHIQCCDTGRRSCFNLENSHHVAVDGFRLEGGLYGIRAVGADYAAADQQRGIAMLNNDGFNQCADPFFTGQSSWIAVENNIATGGGSCDGHGIYLSNGGDYMIVRGNNLHSNSSSDFQINADPISTCADVGISYTDPICDGSALDGLGQGVSEYILVEGNYFHDGDRQGPNFTSVRNSIVRNNVIGFYALHGTSFWQETSNPKLGSSGNQVHHNLFMGDSNRHVLQFIQSARDNDVRNNVFLAISRSGQSVLGSPTLLEVDSSSSSTTFSTNYYVGGAFDGHTVGADEIVSGSFSADWFANYRLDRSGVITDFRPTGSAPFLRAGAKLADTPNDCNGAPRFDPTTLGPFESE